MTRAVAARSPGSKDDPWPEVVSSSRLSNSFLGGLMEICIVARDHRRVMEGLVRLGVGPWRVHTFDSTTVAEQTYRGERADYVLKVCFAEAENVVWEIMQPVKGPTILQEFLDERGEGIHHIAFDCEGLPWDERLDKFASRGHALTQSGKFAGANSFAFFDTASATGTTFETYLIPDAFVWPEPEEWFPGPPPSGASEGITSLSNVRTRATA